MGLALRIRVPLHEGELRRMSITSITAVALQAAAGGLTFRNMLADIPHDAPAIVVYVLLLGSGWLIWRANRGKKD